MIVELHCHTAERSACSHVSAIDLVQKMFFLRSQKWYDLV